MDCRQTLQRGREMSMVHWINSYRGANGEHIVLWQRDHYKYEVEDRRTKKIIARPESFEDAISYCAKFRQTNGYQA